MFRCEFSGELSDGAVWQMVDAMNESSKHRERVRKLVSPAEKPVFIIVETRKKNYNNLTKTKKLRRGKEEETTTTSMTEGYEIVREIKVRQKYADEVRKILAQGGTIPRKPMKKKSFR